MSPDKTYIVIINEFYAYEVTVDMNKRNAAILEAMDIFNNQIAMVDDEEVERDVLDVKVYEKRN